MIKNGKNVYGYGLYQREEKQNGDEFFIATKEPSTG
jgi:hypothetical protein